MFKQKRSPKESNKDNLQKINKKTIQQYHVRTAILTLLVMIHKQIMKMQKMNPYDPPNKEKPAPFYIGGSLLSTVSLRK